MKKVAALLMLTAATSLAACSHRGEYGYNNGNNNGYNNNGYYESGETRSDSDNGQDRDWHREKVSMMVSELFKKCDSNGDGYISWKEYKACTRRMFKNADTNHDGKLSRHEVYAHKLSMMHKMHREMDNDSDNDNDSYNDSSRDNDSYSGSSDNESYNSNRAGYRGGDNKDITTDDNESNGFNNNGYSNNAANVNRYNQNR